MDVENTRPSTTLQRKRTFHDLTEATSSLALQTPIYGTPDAHYNADYFDSSTNGSSSTRGYFHSNAASSPTERTERSTSPSKRVRLIADPSPRRRPGASTGSSDSGDKDSAMTAPPFFTSAGTVQPGRLIPATQHTIAMPLSRILHALATSSPTTAFCGGLPTANWARYRDGSSPALLYLAPGGASSSSFSPSAPSKGLGTFYEPLARNILPRLDSATIAHAETLQALVLCADDTAAMSPERLAGLTGDDAEYVRERYGVLPAHVAPAEAAFLVQAATFLLSDGTDGGGGGGGGGKRVFRDLAERLSDEGTLFLLDGAARVRLVLPLVDLHDVDGALGLAGEGDDMGMGEMGGMGGMVRAVWALDALLRDALVKLAEEDGYVIW